METIDELLFNLRVLGQVSRNKRINTTKQFIYIEEDSIAQGVYRWKDGASRDGCAERISKEIKTLITISCLLCEVVEFYGYEDPRMETLATIKQVLNACIGGISCLCITYNDTNFTGKLQTTIDGTYKHLTALDKTFQRARDAKKELPAEEALVL